MKKEYITPMTEQFQVVMTAILAGSDKNPQFESDGQSGTMSLFSGDDDSNNATGDAMGKSGSLWD